MWDGASIETHVALTHVREAADVPEVISQEAFRFEDTQRLFVGQVRFKTYVTFRNDEPVCSEFFSHELRGHVPRESVFVLPHDLIERSVEVAERAIARFEMLPHLVVLRVFAAALQTEQLFLREWGSACFLVHGEPSLD